MAYTEQRDQMFSMLPADVVVVPSDASANVLAAANRQKLQWGSSVLICTGADDEVELNASLTTAGDNSKVLWLPGTYYTEDSVTLANNQFRLDCAGVTLRPQDETFAAVTVGTGADYSHFRVVGPMVINYFDVTGASCTDSAAIGISLPGTDDPWNFLFDDIYIIYAYQGVSIPCDAHQYKLHFITVQSCTDIAFDIDPSGNGDGASQTNVEIRNCWGITTGGGFKLVNINHLEAGPIEVNYNDDSAGRSIHISNCIGSVNGLDLEENTVTGAYQGLIQIDGGFLTINGCKTYSNTLNPGGGNWCYLWRIASNAQLDMINCLCGSVYSDEVTSGTGYALSIPTGSYVTQRQCSLLAPTANGGTAGTIAQSDRLQISHKTYTDRIEDVLAVSATHVRSNEDLSAATPITFTIDAQPDVPRTLSGHFDAHANITAYTIVIVGENGKSQNVTETFTEADGWDWETSEAYQSVTSITMSARTGTGVGDTMDIGITDVIGFRNGPGYDVDVLDICKNGTRQTVVPGDIDLTYSTYDMATIGLGAGDDFTIVYRVF